MHDQSVLGRVLAGILIGGGVFGVLMMAILVGRIGLSEPFLLGLTLMFCLLMVFAIYIGTELWSGTLRGRRWATMLFASQIPIFFVPGFGFSWFTGLTIAPILHFGRYASDPSLEFSFNFGASATLNLATDASVNSIGINLFALMACLTLLLNEDIRPIRGSRQEINTAS